MLYKKNDTSDADGYRCYQIHGSLAQGTLD